MNPHDQPELSKEILDEIVRELRQYIDTESTHDRVPGLKPGTPEYERYKLGLTALKRADPGLYEQLTNWD